MIASRVFSDFLVSLYIEDVKSSYVSIYGKFPDDLGARFARPSGISRFCRIGLSHRFSSRKRAKTKKFAIVNLRGIYVHENAVPEADFFRAVSARIPVLPVPLLQNSAKV